MPDELIGALERGELYIEYLPTIELESGRCVGAEALTRWHNASGVRPFDLPVAHSNISLAGRLTYWAIETALREMAGWLRAYPRMHLALNVPPQILGRGGGAHAIMNAQASDLMRQLVCEITEEGVPDDTAMQAIQWCRGLGLRVALDDVSLSGAANLMVLARLDVDIIKLPKGVTDKLYDPEELRRIAELVRVTKALVVAEGVESGQQVAALKAAQVQFAQGHYFSRSLRAAAFIEYYVRTQGQS